MDAGGLLYTMALVLIGLTCAAAVSVLIAIALYAIPGVPEAIEDWLDHHFGDAKWW